MKQFLKWLKKSLDLLDGGKENLAYCTRRSDCPDLEQNVHDCAGQIAAELGRQAATLGQSELVIESSELEGAADVDAVRALVARAIAVCEAKRKPSEWLTVPEAALELRMGEQAVRDKCEKNEIEHKREGTRGRGGLGMYLIPRKAIEAYNARQTVGRTPPLANLVPKVRKRPPVVNPFW